nr:DoxX family protein [Kibdelosporangium phytohabitans]
MTVGFMFFSGAIGKLGDTGRFAATLTESGIPLPHLTAAVLAVVELVAGLALMLGLFARIAALVLAVTMAGALISTIAPPLWDKYPDLWNFLSNFFYSPEWLLLGILAWLACAGAEGRGVVPQRGSAR